MDTQTTCACRINMYIQHTYSTHTAYTHSVHMYIRTYVCMYVRRYPHMHSQSALTDIFLSSCVRWPWPWRPPRWSSPLQVAPPTGGACESAVLLAGDGHWTWGLRGWGGGGMKEGVEGRSESGMEGGVEARDGS